MGQGQGGGPKPIVLNADQIAQVEALSAYLSQDQIADYLGICRPTLAAIMERQPEVGLRYKAGKAKSIGVVAQGLVMQARDGNVAAAIFYLKTQAGWKETTAVENTHGVTDQFAELLAHVAAGSKRIGS